MPYDSTSPVKLIAKTYDEQASTIQKNASNKTVDDVEFARQWVGLTAAVDALRSLLEDSYVDWPKGLHTRVSTALKKATEEPNALIRLTREIAQLKPLTPEKVLRKVPVGRAFAEYVMRLAPEGKPDFLLSTTKVRELPVLDDTITDPAYCAGLLEAFCAQVEKARQKLDISYVVFIDKNFGPVGALGMISSIVAMTGLPATIYRERKWSKKADFSGYRPEPDERGLVVYDLVNTGAAIRNAAVRIREEFASNVVGAALLYDLKGTTKCVKVPGGDAVVIFALDGAGRETEARPLPRVNRRAREAARAESAGGKARSFPLGEEMQTNQPQWRADLGLYRNDELVALTFKSQKMMGRAIKAIWNEPEFEGMPADIPSGRVLFVPKAAAVLLRTRKVVFEELPIVDSRGRRSDKAA